MVAFKILVGADPKSIDLLSTDYRYMAELDQSLETLLSKTNSDSIIRIFLNPPASPVLSFPMICKTVVNKVLKNPHDVKECIFFVKDQKAKDLLIKYLPQAKEISSKYKSNKIAIQIVVNDIISIAADTLVNASNAELKLGGGVSGAIRDSADPSMQKKLTRLAQLKPLEPGDVRITESFGLPKTNHIVHVNAVKGTPDVVTLGLANILDLCREKNLSSVAIPAIGTGVGGLDQKMAGRIFAEVFTRFAKNNPDYGLEIIVPLFDLESFHLFSTEFGKHFNHLL